MQDAVKLTVSHSWDEFFWCSDLTLEAEIPKHAANTETEFSRHAYTYMFTGLEILKFEIPDLIDDSI